MSLTTRLSRALLVLSLAGMGTALTSNAAQTAPEGRPGLWLEATRAKLNGATMPIALDAPGTVAEDELPALRKALAAQGVPQDWQPLLRCHAGDPPGTAAIRQSLSDECPGVRFRPHRGGFDYQGQCEKHGGRSTIAGQIHFKNDSHMTRRSTFEADVMGQSVRAETDTVMRWLSADCATLPAWLKPQWLPALQARP